MNLLINNFLVFFCLFPVWFIKFKIYRIDILYFITFFIIFNFLIIWLLKFFQKLPNKIYYNLIISGVIVFGFDNHLSLHRELTNSVSFLALNFGGQYYSSVALLLIIFAIVLLILIKTKENGIKIFLVAIFTLSISSLFNSSKSINNLKNFNKQNYSTKSLPTIVIIFDEMSGMNSFESQTKEGKIFDNQLREISKKNDLILYENIFTNNKSTLKSLSSLFNFEAKINNNEYIKNENKFYVNNTLMKNKFFDMFESISVFQSLHLNFCEHKRVSKCKSFNPFEKKEYIRGFKDNKFTHLINGWKFDGSITSLLTWRILRKFNLIDVSLSPQGEKASFVFLLEQISNDIKSKKFDLIITHALVPHKPYGYTKNCYYEGSRSLGNYNNSLNLEKHTMLHNTDRLCTIKFVDKFLENLKIEKIKFNSIYFLSDHGARNDFENPNSSLNTIFFIKDDKKKYLVIKDKKILQDEFKRIFKD